MSLLKRFRRILGNERATAAHDVAHSETKVAVAAIPAPSKSEPPRFVDSQRNPNLPDTRKWAELNRPSFTRRSRYVTYAGRDKRGNVVLLRRDLVSGELEPEAMTPFALKLSEKE